MEGHWRRRRRRKNKKKKNIYWRVASDILNKQTSGNGWSPRLELDWELTTTHSRKTRILQNVNPLTSGRLLKSDELLCALKLGNFLSG
jgi:hypothetical protein